MEIKKFKNFKLNEWSTLSRKGNDEVDRIMNDLKNHKISLENAFKGLYKIDNSPELFDDAEIDTGTLNSIFEFIDEETTFDIKDAIKIYQKIFYNSLKEALIDDEGAAKIAGWMNMYHGNPNFEETIEVTKPFKITFTKEDEYNKLKFLLQKYRIPFEVLEKQEK